VATADAEIGGKAIREGDRVVAWLASANRDEDAFERAAEFDVSRHPNLHVGFGGGAHFCVGGPLAKIEISFALQETLERYDGIEIIGPVERVHANFVGGLKRLPVRLRRKTPAAHTSVRNV
ncbi:MAG: cytochrome P450, partial [Gammaproteobacteria bacterium]